jgi:multisubunit Na+/H+ antiporter MnhB subunit
VPDLIFDLALATLLLGMAWGALYARNHGAGISLFIAFGLILALIWARLGAVDLALAEAAIGAGLTGVLLLQAARASPAGIEPEVNRPAYFVPATLFIFLVTALITVTAFQRPESVLRQVPLLPTLVEANLPESGVKHPVTAVLLNFRAWDTLLELLVLFLALLGVRQLYPVQRPMQPLDRPLQTAWPLLLAWGRFLAPVLVLVGGYLLWSGTKSPGGAFQAGAVLAAAGVILRLVGLLPPLRWSFWWVRSLLLLGPIFFVLVALATYLLGEGWLTYPRDQAGIWIIAIEIGATLSIALTLILLVVGEQEDIRP